MKRRDLFKAGLGLAALRNVRLRGDAARRTGRSARGASAGGSSSQPNPAAADYIVVGSGAGGGTVAARLAESGYTVLLLEAGGDPRTLQGGDPVTPDGNALPQDYDVPAFHPLATENAALRWDFFVRHYADAARQAKDTKYRETVGGRRVDGVLYPRAGTLGGCTAHNAMILVYPHNADWDQLADLTGDRSWAADRMRKYFERIEDCRHRPLERFLAKFGLNPSRHGWSGWLQTEHSIPDTALADDDLRDVILDSAKAALGRVAFSDADRQARLKSRADPNDWRVVADSASGVRYTPLTTKNHQRVGTRERVLDVAARHPDRLKVQLNALATRVLFDERRRAIGVEYLEGERLYRAHARVNDSPGTVRRVYAGREVILAGGAFNTPQLLMLSGIGPAAELQRHGIEVLYDLPGVGINLQDRYEVAVVNRVRAEWQALRGATLTSGDPQFAQWSSKRAGVYMTNGAILSVVLPSGPGAPVPDLFCYALIGDFRGYFPGYSKRVADNHQALSWVVLKAHTSNTGGRVTLRSADPRDAPDVNFHYFDEGTDARGEDLDAVVAGIEFARDAARPLKERGLIVAEDYPGDALKTREELRDFVRREAWGHHASCTCRIGTPAQGGVLTSDFKVHGTEGLRVVDASVFPRVPGHFIVSAIYMIGEKAADVIVADAKRS